MSPADLRIPLSALPGFDPVGLFVCYEGEPAGLLTAVAADYVVLDSRREDLSYAEYVDIDVADSSTRDRVARYIAARVGLEAGCTAPKWVVRWRTVPSLDPEMAALGAERFEAARKWQLGTLPEAMVYSPVPGEGAWCPTLAGLDPADDTRLPDGSRFVDAVALARVAVHVGAR